VSEKQVALHSSAISVIYDIAFDVDVAGQVETKHAHSKSAPKHSTEFYIRRHMRTTAPAPHKPTAGLDFALVREWLIARGALKSQTDRSLIISMIIIGRVFYALRAADLICLAHTESHPLDGWAPRNGDSRIFFPFYMLKTARLVHEDTHYWVDVPLRPMNPDRLRSGFKQRALQATRIVDTCCFVRAAAELRKRMLPKLRSLHPLHKVHSRVCYEKCFIPHIDSKMTLKSSRFRFIGATRVNTHVKEMHTTVFGEIPVVADKGWLARWYRHNALSAMHRSGASEEALELSEHTTMATFKKCYKIGLHPTFEDRLNSYSSLSAFSTLSGPERLLA